MNEQNLKTVNIKGKEYVEVNERLKYFRKYYPDYILTSEIVSMQDGVVVMKASIFGSDGKILATGHAYEKEDSSFINKTSYIENCETSAWGRALANFGIGLDNSVASAEEVKNAIINQEPKNEPIRQEASNPYSSTDKTQKAVREQPRASERYINDSVIDELQELERKQMEPDHLVQTMGGDWACNKCNDGILEPQYWNDNPWLTKDGSKQKHVCNNCKHYEWIDYNKS